MLPVLRNVVLFSGIVLGILDVFSSAYPLEGTNRPPLKKIRSDLSLSSLSLATEETLLQQAESLYKQGCERRVFGKSQAEEGTKLIKEAAALNYGPAQYDLGIMFKNGQGVTKNIKNAIFWLKEASKKLPAALNALGSIYEFHEKNTFLAKKYYTLALGQGYDLARQNLERIQASERGQPFSYEEKY